MVLNKTDMVILKRLFIREAAKYKANPKELVKLSTTYFKITGRELKEDYLNWVEIKFK